MQRQDEGADAPEEGNAPAEGEQAPVERPIERGERPPHGDRGPGDRGPGDRGPGSPMGDRGPRPGGRGGRDFRSRRKVCAFCVDHVREIDYKEVGKLRRYLSDRAKIEPRRKTGTCAKHQRMLTVALKNARHMALLPYTSEHIRGI